MRQKSIAVLLPALALCPALAGADSALHGLGLGLLTVLSLLAAGLIYSLFESLLSERTRPLIYLVCAAGTVTAFGLLAEALFPGLYRAVGAWLPLAAVQGLLFREVFPELRLWISGADTAGSAGGSDGKEKKKGKKSDAKTVGKGSGTAVSYLLFCLSYIASLGILGLAREVLGSWSFFSLRFLPEDMEGMGALNGAAGAFLVLAFAVMVVNAWKPQESEDGKGDAQNKGKEAAQ